MLSEGKKLYVSAMMLSDSLRFANRDRWIFFGVTTVGGRSCQGCKDVVSRPFLVSL